MEDSAKRGPSNQTILNKVVRGGAWVYGRSVLTNIINLGVMAILARTLSPADFGLIALALVILRLLTVIGAQGVNEFVIYDNGEGKEERAQAAFWMDLTFSVITSLAGAVLVPYVTRFYSEPNLEMVLWLLLLRYPLDTLSKVPDALIKKKLYFQKLVVRDTVLEIITSLFSVIMALSGGGVLSLILPGIILSPVRAIMVFWMTRWSPGWNFRFHLWGQIFNYSANVIGGTLAGYVFSNGDTIIVGKILGSFTLGIYNLAWTASNMIGNNIVGLINQLAFPALSLVSNDLSRLRVGLGFMMRILSIVTFPLLVGLFVVADHFVLTVYGSQWTDSILLLRIFILFAMRYSVGSPAGIVFKAVGRTDITFKLGLYTIPFFLTSIWIGSYFGIVGVAISVTVTRLIIGFITFEITARVLKTNFMNIVEPLINPLLASCWMGLVVFIIKLPLETIFPPGNLIGLLALVVVGGVTYLVLLRTVYNDLSHDLVRSTASVLGPLQNLLTRLLNAQ